MKAIVRCFGLVFSIAALVFCCSCEEHQVGEMPEVQKEHVEGPGETADHNADSVKERPAASSTPATPGEYFPSATPR